MFERKLKEYCGVFGIFGHPEASNLTYLGLYTLQHRGQEAAGICSTDGEKLHVHRQMGLVADVFQPSDLEQLPGSRAIGHVRYSTHGSSELKNAQPVLAHYEGGDVAVVHNGNLTNADVLREELHSRGAIFQTTTDSEVVLHLLAKSNKSTLLDRAIDGLKKVEGAYSLLFLTQNTLLAARDPHGFRPLVLGELRGAKVFASETCALDLIGAKFIREIEPGELVLVNQKGEVTSHRPFDEVETRACIFEHIYFARPDSRIFGASVYESRKALGAKLFAEHPADVDVVIPVPDSGVPAAMGFAEAANAPYELGLVRNHYVGRTFIEPQQSIRNFGVRVKLNPVREVIVGKRVALVDDSIVRGTTSKKIIKMIRDAGASEVHFRISAPPIRYSCYFGIDTPTREELIAAQMSLEEICEHLGASSLGYLTSQGMLSALGAENNGNGDGEKGHSCGYCTACFTGHDLPVSS